MYQRQILTIKKQISAVHEDLQFEYHLKLEELKLVKQEFKEDLSPANWVQSLLKVAGKIGMYRLAKKVI